MYMYESNTLSGNKHWLLGAYWLQKDSVQRLSSPVKKKNQTTRSKYLEFIKALNV